MNSLLLFAAAFNGGALAHWSLSRLWTAAELRAEARATAHGVNLTMKLRGKVVRHSPTGRVGICLGCGKQPHRFFGFFKASYLAIITDDKAVAETCLANPFGIMTANEEGLVSAVPASEIAAALPEEIAAFA